MEASYLRMNRGTEVEGGRGRCGRSGACNFLSERLEPGGARGIKLVGKYSNCHLIHNFIDAATYLFKLPSKTWRTWQKLSSVSRIFVSDGDGILWMERWNKQKMTHKDDEKVILTNHLLRSGVGECF